MTYPVEEFTSIVNVAENIVVVQADNPDGDSLGTALALEAILHKRGKNVSLYCAVDVPEYLRYLEGWSRVSKELPRDFDASIIVDTSTKSLFEKAMETNQYGRLSHKPCVVLDHHEETQADIDFATLTINDHTASSTSEVVFYLCKQAEWPIPSDAWPPLMTGILGDTQGLTNQLAGANTYRAMAELIALGADRPALEESRREHAKMHESIFRYKADLIKRVELHEDNAIGIVTVPQQEINTYSPLFNPGALIQMEMLQVQGVQIGIVLKAYDDGRITGMIRCNPGAEIANKVAVHFGGGGHGFAAGFKIKDGRPLNHIKSECIAVASDLLAKLNKGKPDETTQYTYSTD